MRPSLVPVLLFFLLFSAPSAAAPPTVLFDQGHGQVFTIEKEGELQLGKLGNRLRSNGWQVAATTEPLTHQSLATADALIISGAFHPLTRKEIEAVGNFLQNGGHLAVMLHIAPPLATLLEGLGVTFPNGVVRESDHSRIISGEPLNFRVSNLGDHPLTENSTHFSVYGAWPLFPAKENIRMIAMTSPKAWVDLNRDHTLSPGDMVGEFATLIAGNVGEGEFVIFADDAVFQNRYLTGENERLADNLSRWLMPGKSSADFE